MVRYPDTDVITYKNLGTTGSNGIYYEGTPETLTIQCRLKAKPAYPRPDQSGLKNNMQYTLYFDPCDTEIPVGSVHTIGNLVLTQDVETIKYQTHYEIWLTP